MAATQTIDVVMPQMGVSVSEGTVTKWLKKEGDKVSSGEAIETLFSDRLEEHAHRLAQHFRLAGDHRRAVKYHEMAGDAAHEISRLPAAADST